MKYIPVKFATLRLRPPVKSSTAGLPRAVFQGKYCTGQVKDMKVKRDVCLPEFNFPGGLFIIAPAAKASGVRF